MVQIITIQDLNFQHFRYQLYFYLRCTVGTIADLCMASIVIAVSVE